MLLLLLLGLTPYGKICGPWLHVDDNVRSVRCLFPVRIWWIGAICTYMAFFCHSENKWAVVGLFQSLWRHWDGQGVPIVEALRLFGFGLAFDLALGRGCEEYLPLPLPLPPLRS